MSTTAQKKLVPTRTGVVTSDKRDKTRTVVFEFQTMHPKYGKYVKNRTRLQFHDEKNQSHTGDLVEISECRPVSKSKQWKLVRIIDQRSVTRVQNVVSGAVEIEPVTPAAPAVAPKAVAPKAAAKPAPKKG